MTSDHVLKPLVQGWKGKIRAAIRHKKPFQEVADECMAFFSGAAGFMWERNYKHKFWDDKGAGIKPRFHMTIAKAFELVAIFGPVLYHKNPVRTVNPRRGLPLEPMMFGDPNDPAGQQAFQQVQQQQQHRDSEDRMRSELMSRYMNWTPNEMPSGGLAEHAEMAVTEALVKGRGVLRVEPYQYPGSGQTMPVQSYVSVDNLLIDPDAENFDFDSCWWIAIKNVMHTWQAERRWGLKKDSLRDKGDAESNWSRGEREGDDLGNYRRGEGNTNDMITVWEIFSRGGIGARLCGLKNSLAESLDEAAGDFCHLVIAENVEYPLNFPDKDVFKASDEEVREVFGWPIPTWTDDRWPISVLDFYKKPNSAWPIAPMAPGLGELKFINVMVSHLTNRIWTSSRDFIGVAESAYQDLRRTLESGQDQVLLKIPDLHGDIDKVVKFITQPQTNRDVWLIIEAVMELFDKRVGLSELLYGMKTGNTQDRSATETSAKREFVSVRPDYMASRVEKWLTEASRLEAFVIRWFVTAEDVAEVLGPIGAQLWRSLIEETDVNRTVRELEYRIEAGSARKPNKDREVANANQAMQVLLPVLDNHANATTDTGPVNNIIKRFLDAIEMPTDGLAMGQRMPPPPPPQQGPTPEQMQMQMQQQESQFKQQEMQQKLQSSQADSRMRLGQRQVEMQQDAQQHSQEMIQDQQRHVQEMAQDRELASANIKQLIAQRRAQANPQAA